MLNRLKGLLTPPIVIGTVAVLAVASLAVAYVITNQSPAAAYVTPTMGPLVQEVDTTGSVDAAQAINLGFQVSGTVSDAGPQVGTNVEAGATLGTLSSGTQQAAVEQAEAALEMQQANLSSLQSGATPQTVAVSQTGVTNAQASLSQAQQSLLAAVQSAYTASYDAVDDDVDQFIANPHTPNPTLDFTLTNSQDQSSIINERIQMETLLAGWQQYVNALPSDSSQINTSGLASTTRDNLEEVSSFLNLVATGLTEAVPSGSYSTSVIEGYEASVATGEADVSADLSSVNTAASAVTAAQSALASAQSQLNLTQAPATQQSLEAQNAQVAAAQASLDAAKATLAETVLTAPISGTITVNNMEPGQIETSGQTQISMISDSAFQFDAYVSEADLAKIQVGDSAEVLLDAYQNEAPLSAQVIEINPAATVQDGVSSYEVKLQFNENDPRISAGETGSATITTQSLSDVMSVPTSAIIMNNDEYFVIENTASGDQEVQVQIGIESSPDQSGVGYTQILSGLSPDAEIRTFGTQQ